MDVNQVADRLYRMPPGQFVTARNAAADEARTGGERDVAARIRALRRPTLGAWLANLLALEHGEEVQGLLELGDGLRRATEQLHGDELRKLSAQKQAVVSALKGQARAAAVAAGDPPSEGALEDLEQTLLAVLTDSGAAATFLGGRLTGALSSKATAPAASMPPAAKAPPVAAPARAQQHGAQASERRRRVALARERVVEADRAARTADADAARARKALDRAAAQRDRQHQRVEEIAAQLAKARDSERDLAAAQRSALARVENTDREARRAHGRARDAHAHLDQLDRAA